MKSREVINSSLSDFKKDIYAVLKKHRIDKGVIFKFEFTEQCFVEEIPDQFDFLGRKQQQCVIGFQQVYYPKKKEYIT